MAQKAPMIGVVVSLSLRERLEAARVAQRMKSRSEFCALLLEYAVTKLEKGVGLVKMLDDEGINPFGSSQGGGNYSATGERRAKTGREVDERRAQRIGAERKSHRAKVS